MDIRPIRTDQDHLAALAAIEACWGAAEGTEEGDKLDVLLALARVGGPFASARAHGRDDSQGRRSVENPG